MTKKNPVYLTVLLVALAIVLTFQLTVIATDGYSRLFSEEETPAADTSEDAIDPAILQKISDIAATYAAIYPGEIDPDKIEEYLMNAFIAGAGDEHGNYISADDLDEYLASVEGNFDGIGVSVLYNADIGAIEIISVFPDSPAERVGLLPGDLIIYVGRGDSRQSVAELGYYTAVGLIKGEAGTFAEFAVLRGGEEIEFSVERAEVTDQTVSFHMYSHDDRVAVIRISQFERVTFEQFEQAMTDAAAAGAEAYVFDMRNNPGGDLSAIVSVLDMLLPEGPIIRIEYKDSKNNTQMTSDAECVTAPMAVLCNGNTASAGELFCAALQDYDKATVVGTQTYGKGTMQKMFKLTDGSAISMTIAYYLPPYSENYHGAGVTPDILCEVSDDLAGININKFTDDNDNQLRAAVAALGLADR